MEDKYKDYFSSFEPAYVELCEELYGSITKEQQDHARMLLFSRGKVRAQKYLMYEVGNLTAKESAIIIDYILELDKIQQK